MQHQRRFGAQNVFAIALAIVAACASAFAADEPAPATSFESILAEPLLHPDQSLRDAREFCKRRVPLLPELTTVADWEAYVADIRERTLANVVFRGQAAEWRKAPTEVEWLDSIEGGPEYTIRKLRFQAAPGLWVPGLLYEPRELSAKVPVALNVNGHDGAGKVADYKQLRCINMAKRGMLVLNLEWLGMGQLRGDDFGHYRMNQLDLCGTSGLAPFYLSMSRALDILLQHEHADPARVVVSGLSGGGWQTIFISGLDERVTLSDPVAGYSSFLTRADYLSDLGDSEQTPCDLATVVDYTHLTAMRAPRPTLLTFNDRDRCCFAAPHALPPLLATSRPVYALYGKPENLVAHINHVPGTHNFEQDNREALYRMIGEHFYPDQEFNGREIDSTAEVKTAEQLHVDLPADNAGFNTLAKRLVAELPAAAPISDAAAARVRLAEIVHVNRPKVVRADLVSAEESGTRQINRWKFQVGDEWTISAIEIIPEGATRTAVVIADEGRAKSAPQVTALVEAGSRVVAVDLFYFGDAKVSQRDLLYGLLIAAVGERPLGVQVDQLLAVCHWLADDQMTGPVTVVALGRRNGLVATVAAALDEAAIAGLELHAPFTSLRQVVDESLQIPDGPELFCFGLLSEFDVPRMNKLIAPRPVTVSTP